MAQNFQNLTAEQQAALDVLATEAAEYYTANCPQEVKDAIAAMMAEMAANPAKGAEMKAQMSEKFQAADANADGRLDAAEFATFIAALEDMGRASGTYWPQKEGLRQRYYDWFISVTGDASGLTADEYAMGQRVLGAAIKAKSQ